MKNYKSNIKIYKKDKSKSKVSTSSIGYLTSIKGVTLAVLVITIIVLLILAGVSITLGNLEIDNYKDNILESEIMMVQTAVYDQYEKYLATKDNNLLVGTKCDENGNENIDEEYNLLKPEDLLKIGMENPKDTYIVNYKTGEIINKTSKKSDGTILKLNGILN